MHPLVHYVKNKWPQNGHFSYLLGLSGGADSVVLLHILSQIINNNTDSNETLSAIHINHGISPNSNIWEKFCQEYCQDLNIKLNIVRHQVTKSGGESLENNARKIRYQEFYNSRHNVIVLAHHQNDQIETTLSQIFRGSDLHNVAAMQMLKHKQNVLLWRPLLNISRVQIEEYAKEHRLEYITDESNHDISYLRNFIRHKILPELLKFDKDISPKILKLPNQLQNMLALIDEVASSDLNDILDISGSTILVEKLSMLSYKRQQNAVAYFIKQQNLPLPTNKQLEEFIRQSLTSKWDKTPYLKLDNNNNIIKQKSAILIQQFIPTTSIKIC